MVHEALPHQPLHGRPRLQVVRGCVVGDGAVREAGHVLSSRLEAHGPVDQVEVKVRELEVSQRLQQGWPHIIFPAVMPGGLVHTHCMVRWWGLSRPVFSVPEL